MKTSKVVLAGLLGLALTKMACADITGTNGITLVPIPVPEKVSIENRGSGWALLGGLGRVAEKSIESGRVSEFKMQMSRNGFNPQDELKSAIVKELAAVGIATSEDGIKYDPDDPTAIDYEHSTEAQDRILIVHIPNLGLLSGFTTTKFLPRLNVSVDVIERKTEKTLFSKWFYYGADARKDTDDQVTSPPTCMYATYEEAAAQGRQLADAYKDGIGKISHMAALQIKAALDGDKPVK